MDASTPAQIVYWINQGGPIPVTALVYGCYRVYQLLSDFLTELKTLNEHIVTQNDLLTKSLEKK